jgi:hypothetical protein
VSYFRGLLRALGLDQPNATTLYVDNAGAVELAKELKSCARRLARRPFSAQSAAPHEGA